VAKSAFLETQRKRGSIQQIKIKKEPVSGAPARNCPVNRARSGLTSATCWPPDSASRLNAAGQSVLPSVGVKNSRKIRIHLKNGNERGANRPVRKIIQETEKYKWA